VIHADNLNENVCPGVPSAAWTTRMRAFSDIENLTVQLSKSSRSFSFR
jgi:hypothetical protein